MLRSLHREKESATTQPALSPPNPSEVPPGLYDPKQLPPVSYTQQDTDYCQPVELQVPGQFSPFG